MSEKIYRVTVQEDAEGEAYIELPPDLLRSCGWDEHTRLVWVVEDENILLREMHDSGN